MSSIKEKQELPIVVEHQPAPKPTSKAWHKPLAALLISLLALPYLFPSLSPISLVHTETIRKSTCEQAAPVFPKSFDVSSLVAGQKGRIVDWLSKAVQVPTEVYDVMGEIGEDPRWDVFYDFSDCESAEMGIWM
jgi:Gly-Xaa carboxypeptidase